MVVKSMAAIRREGISWGVVLGGVLLLSVLGLQADAQGASTSPCLPLAGENRTSQLGPPYVIQGQASVEHAKNFTVRYGANHKVVQNYGANETYVLKQCGTAVEDEVAAMLKTTEPSSVKQFTVPLESIAVDGTTSVGFLELLGLGRRIKFLGEIVSPCVRRHLGQNIQALNTTDGPGFLQQMEQVSALLDTSVVYIEGMSVSNLSNSISFRDNTGEYSPLKRAEWIKYISVFFNLEQVATGIFRTIEDNYNCLSKTTPAAIRPVVAWVSVLHMDGEPQTYRFSGSTYLLEFVNHAGGVNLVNETTSFNASIPSDVTTFHEMLKKVDILIDDTYNGGKAYNLANFTALYKLPAGVVYPFMTASNIWRSDKRINGDTYYTDWFETAVAQPQRVLGDLISIINPLKEPAATCTFFRNLAKDEPEVALKADNCPAVDSQPNIMVVPCSNQPVPMQGAPTTTWSFAAVLASILTTAIMLYF